MRDVSQISPPIRILLVCAVAFMAAYMLFLRPKPVEVEPAAEPAPNVQTTDPAVSQPGQIAESAQGAADAANAQTQAQESVDGVDAGESAAAGTAPGTTSVQPGAADVPAIDPADLVGLPKPVRRAVEDRKTLVLLFWNPKSADDREVRRELRKVDDWNGRVAVQAAPIRTISRYGRITRGADVEQSPTVVVVDSQLRAETLVGYVDRVTIDQMVADALRNSGGLLTDTYLRKINNVCASFSNRVFAVPDPSNGAQYAAYMDRATVASRAFAADFAAVPAPRKHRALKRATVRDNAALTALYADVAVALGSNPSSAKAASVASRFSGRERALARRYNARMDAQNVIACGRNG